MRSRETSEQQKPSTQSGVIPMGPPDTAVRYIEVVGRFANATKRVSDAWLAQVAIKIDPQ